MPRRRLDGSGWLRGLRVWRKLTELFYKISSSLIYMYIQKVHTKEYTKTLSNFIYELIKNGNIWNEKKLHISKCGTSIISQWISVTANFKFADPYESQICTYMYEHISDYQCIRSESKNVNIMLIIIISNKFTAIKIIFFFLRETIELICNWRKRYDLVKISKLVDDHRQIKWGAKVKDCFQAGKLFLLIIGKFSFWCCAFCSHGSTRNLHGKNSEVIWPILNKLFFVLLVILLPISTKVI